MDTTVQKWGNSLALRIPRSLARDACLHQGSVVEVACSEGRIIIRPRRKRRYSLARLLKGIRKENLRSERDWGTASGREVW